MNENNGKGPSSIPGCSSTRLVDECFRVLSRKYDEECPQHKQDARLFAERWAGRCQCESPLERAFYLGLLMHARMNRHRSPFGGLAAGLPAIGGDDPGVAREKVPVEFADDRRIGHVDLVALKYCVGGSRVDFAIRRYGRCGRNRSWSASDLFAVELDGCTYHGTPERFVRDRARDRHLLALGLLPLHFAYGEVWHNSGGTAVLELDEMLTASVRRRYLLATCSRSA